MGLKRDNTAVRDYRPRRSDDDDDDTNTEDGLQDEPETPAARSSSLVRPGWDTAKKKIKEVKKTYADDWLPPEGSTLVKFLEDEPFASVGSHWVDEIKEGQRSFYCLEEDCPLCDVGQRVMVYIYFNVVELPVKGGKPEVKALRASPTLATQIEEAHNSARGPLSRHYWMITRKNIKRGKGSKTEYTLDGFKARDLADDLDLDPAAIAASLEGAEPYTADIIKLPSREDLEEIVATHIV